ncbi:hypothetical protein F0562_024372 [Nyssa sinensis]|uniref:Bromo domain-containing protein n=1 Tax=Nyssa sinensis TaxID=561372 RepID=A0A5J5BDE8_9ASTE|nr:hypothetical protein F0562_024372 [Nyssa sinensis]
MDGRGGCCIARYAGGPYDMSKVDRIMLRFRPIAPKPASSGSVSGRSPPENNDVHVRTGRGKRRYVRDSNNNNKRCYNRKRKASPPSGGSISGGETVVTLPLLPETPDGKETPARGSPNDHFDLTGAKKQVQNVPIWLDFTNQTVNDNHVSPAVGQVSVGLDRTVVMMPQAVRLVGSIVTVECVTDTWVDGNGLGCTDEERKRNLEMDTCPGFISDGLNRVGWTNGAYREMVVGRDREVVVWLVMKEKVPVPVIHPAFSCRVRMQYTCGKERSSLTLPCDVWRMDGGGFAWRLDVKAALCLGRECVEILGVNLMAPTVPIEYTGHRESKIFSKKVLSQMMGKTRKFSKGPSSGFVPDYRHAVETMAESEGFGSSGRVDMEMTASEDSCAPKRKCISLNVDSYDRYGVPIQILSLSKMSQSERKDLELRLKSELEQVRILQKKIASLSSDVVVLSPSSDIPSCSDGQKRPPFESFGRSIEVSAPQGKKRAPPGRNGPRTKRAAAGRIESVKQAARPSASNAILMKQCETLLNRLMSHKFGWVFNTPVDVVKLNIPDYFNVIKHPMDLGTVKSKLLSGEYWSPMGFASDVRLTFSNAMTYNPSGNDFHIMAETLSKYFEARWKPIEKKLPVTTEALAPAPSRSRVHVETETANQMPPLKKKKITSVEKEVKQEPVKRVMSDVEKHKLSTELEALLAELPESIIDFLKEQSFNASQTAEDEIEIDIDTLSDDTLFMLRKLLDEYLLDKQKKQGKAEPCEMELHNESGFSNSSVQPCKANDPIDEDVDICGNDPPISSYPPVEIEKDAALRNSKCSSSSSSSSESGSSSSDSDSGSSSSSESDGAKASVPAGAARENLGSGVNLEPKTSVLGDPDIENHALNGLSQVEQNSESKSVAVEADGSLEGESAPSERQVSPEKLYRAALLRSRFADTILKAQEKTLEKGEQDPDKLRLEREELERRRREEKARLQAEAKAAEEARRKAEAEAAAEARRKRELEREAARQALQKMEKTVEINENCSFKLQGSSNPLEQLGLYMKVDDEEEEEGESQSVPAAVNDTEEGEID